MKTAHATSSTVIGLVLTARLIVDITLSSELRALGSYRGSVNWRCVFMSIPQPLSGDMRTSDFPGAHLLYRVGWRILGDDRGWCGAARCTGVALGPQEEVCRM